MKGNKGYSAKGSGTLEIYKNTSLFDDMILKFLNEGIDTYFDLQVVTEDPTSNAGRSSMVLETATSTRPLLRLSMLTATG